MRKIRIPNKSKINIIICFTLQILVIVSLIAQVIYENWANVFLCVITLILFIIPNFISTKFKLKIPDTLEAIIYIFIFSAAILGEIQNFYGAIPYWDSLLHTLNGFICAAIGFSLINILNNGNNIDMTPIFVSLVAFCFSMTIGVFWEFVEFSLDHYLAMDTQKDQIVYQISSVKLNDKKINKTIKINNIDKTIIYSRQGTTIINGYLDIGLRDTIKDLFVNFIGALIFSILGYLYVKNSYNYHFIENFVPKANKKVL